MKILFATNNRHKLDEAGAILGSQFDLLTTHECGITEEIPENEVTIEANALGKARYVNRRTGLDCFADDTGLEVGALGGAPGVRSARYAGDDHDFAANTALLLQNMEGIADRRACFRTIIALILEGKEYLFEGEVRGEITALPRGEQGFGYDPVFLPEGYGRTFAEMSAEEKNSISHRARAMSGLVKFLRRHNEGITDEDL